MGIIKCSAFFIIVFIMSCYNFSEENLIKDDTLLNINKIINEQVKYIDNNVLLINKHIQMNDILDTISLKPANGKEVFKLLLDLKYPTSYIKEKNKHSYRFIFKDHSKPLKSIIYKKDTQIQFLIERSNLLYHTQKEYNLLINKGIDIKGYSKTFWGDKDQYHIKMSFN